MLNPTESSSRDDVDVANVTRNAGSRAAGPPVRENNSEDRSMSRESKSSAKNETVDVPNDTITAESPTEAEGPAPENRQGKEELEAIVRQGAVDVPGDMGTAEPERWR